MPTRDEIINALEQKLREQKAKKAAAQKKEKSKEAQKNRRQENKQKYLVGAFVIEQMNKAGIGFPLLTYESASFDEWLTRPTERELCGLKPLPRTPSPDSETGRQEGASPQH